jgi:LacI family transcriptional regulator
VSGRAVLTLYDVASAAGVSIATVSRVMHEQPGVRPATRQRVLDVIEELGYVPDGAAQSMARHRKEVIGLVTAENPNADLEQEGLHYVEEVLRGVEFVLSRLDWSVLFSIVRHDVDSDVRRQLQKITAKVDGLLIMDGILAADQLERLAARVPVVVPAGPSQGTCADVITVENYSGMAVLTRHLLKVHGYRRLFYVDGPPEVSDAWERRRAFEETVAKYPGAAITGVFPGGFETAGGRQAVRRILGSWPGEPGPRPDLPDVIVCANDKMAIGAIRELQSAGVSIPADVAVSGFDDIFTGSIIAPPLTTVRQPTRLLGERACTMLLERIADPSLAPRVVRLSAELLIRQSCGCPPATRPPRSTAPQPALVPQPATATPPR